MLWLCKFVKVVHAARLHILLQVTRVDVFICSRFAWLETLILITMISAYATPCACLHSSQAKQQELHILCVLYTLPDLNRVSQQPLVLAIAAPASVCK